MATMEMDYNLKCLAKLFKLFLHAYKKTTTTLFIYPNKLQEKEYK